MEQLKRIIDDPDALPSNLPTDGLAGQLRRTCCYIVAAVILRENQILLIQEAKVTCRGQWYLPAGRLEYNETFVEGVKREVLEEAGVLFEPTRVISVEGESPGWLRINFTGEVTGGALKTKEDSESIQAKWFDLPEVLNCRVNLRHADIIPAINQGIAQRTLPKGCLPVLVGRPNFTVSLVVLHHNKSTPSEVSVVGGECGGLPTETLRGWNHPGPRNLGNFYGIAHHMLKEMGFEKPSTDVQYHGILTLAHDGREDKDGLHMTMVYSTNHYITLTRSWVWESSSGRQGEELLDLISSYRVIPATDLKLS